ncbi:MAG: HAD hydrolase-like protein [Legionellaceae bacterium]|nr:HAD hydrolase-like protein [Legionellaceae bacterium]
MCIKSYKVLFWDFDGVIKDSVNLKTDAFVNVFEEHGSEITAKVKAHHLANGGMSRFDKLPIYGRWIGKEFNQEQIDVYVKKISALVFDGVLNSAWVPGVEDYLRNNRYDQKFILVSATPHDELIAILDSLRLHDCFEAVYGAPFSKRDAISTSLSDFDISPNDCIMIGDARADLEAAEANDVNFLLRRHDTNDTVFATYSGFSVKDFIGL